MKRNIDHFMKGLQRTDKNEDVSFNAFCLWVFRLSHLHVVLDWCEVAASSSLDSHVKIWDLENGKQVKSIDLGPGKYSGSSL